MEICSILMHLILNNPKEEDKYKDKGIKDKFSVLYFTSNIMCYALKPVLIGYQLVSQGRRYMFNTERVQINVYLVRYLSRSKSYNGTETETSSLVLGICEFHQSYF